jgi:hypothetical protein
MNRFKRKCCTISKTLNNKRRRDTQTKFYKVMEVSVLTYGSEICSITNKKIKQEEKIKMQK